METNRMGNSAEGLVAVLGWGYDDFESALKEAELADIEGCARILKVPLPIARYEEMSQVGLKLIEFELERRGAKP